MSQELVKRIADKAAELRRRFGLKRPDVYGACKQLGLREISSELFRAVCQELGKRGGSVTASRKVSVAGGQLSFSGKIL